MQARSTTLENLTFPMWVPVKPPLHFSVRKRKEAEKSLSTAIAALAPPTPQAPQAPQAPTGPRAPRAPQVPHASNAVSDGPTGELFVSNLPFSMTEEELYELFMVFSPVHVSLIQKGGRSLGYGFILLEDSDNMNEVAIASLHEAEFQGRVIRVENAHTFSFTTEED